MTRSSTTELSGRLLLGTPMLVAGTHKLIDPQSTGANADPPGRAFFDAMRGTFMFTELALAEVTSGLMLILGVAVPLATLGLLPIVATIAVYSPAYVRIGPEFSLVVSIVAGVLTLLWVHRRLYLELLTLSVPASRLR